MHETESKLGWPSECLSCFSLCLVGLGSMYLGRAMGTLWGTDAFADLIMVYIFFYLVFIGCYLGMVRSIQVAEMGDAMKRYKTFALVLGVLGTVLGAVPIFAFVL